MHLQTPHKPATRPPCHTGRCLRSLLKRRALSQILASSRGVGQRQLLTKTDSRSYPSPRSFRPVAWATHATAPLSPHPVTSTRPPPCLCLIRVRERRSFLRAPPPKARGTAALSQPRARAGTQRWTPICSCWWAFQGQGRAPSPRCAAPAPAPAPAPWRRRSLGVMARQARLPVPSGMGAVACAQRHSLVSRAWARRRSGSRSGAGRA